MSYSSPYLMPCKNGRLSFRIRIPADVQNCLGRREYRRSLGYQSPSKAKPQVLKLAAAAYEIFAFARAAQEARQDTSGRFWVHPLKTLAETRAGRGGSVSLREGVLLK